MIRKHLNQFGNYGQRLVHALFSPLVLFLVLAGNAVMFLCAYLFFRLEAPVNPELRSYGDALWLAMTTVTTVGFGDIVPHTGIGRAILAALMIIGNFFYLSFGAVLVTMLYNQERDEVIRQERLTRAEVDRLIQELQGLRHEMQRGRGNY
jgi:voltage-gated potassium channel